MTIPDILDALNRGHFDEAEHKAQQALLGRSDAQFAFLLGVAQAKQGRMSDALKAFVQASALDPYAAEPHFAAARAHVLQDRPAEALDAVDQAIAIRPSYAEALALRSDLLARRAAFTARYDVCVVTPTIGTRYLEQAVACVQAQSYANITHLIMVDGPTGAQEAQRVAALAQKRAIKTLILPDNTGAGGYNGHRLYGAAAFLVETPFVAFLDEDNYFRPDHIEALMEQVERSGAEWAYALRTIVSDDAVSPLRDDCESLGSWPSWQGQHHIDMNCYLLSRHLHIAHAPLFHARFAKDTSPDTMLCRTLLSSPAKGVSSGRYSVNYRAGMSQNSVSREFFIRGNAQMQRRHATGYPWARE